MLAFLTLALMIVMKLCWKLLKQIVVITKLASKTPAVIGYEVPDVKDCLIVCLKPSACIEFDVDYALRSYAFYLNTAIFAEANFQADTNFTEYRSLFESNIVILEITEVDPVDNFECYKNLII